MELNPYDPISNLDTTTYEWKCCVRVQSFWKGMNRESQEFWGLNLLLIDDSNSRIHAFANSKYCDDLLKNMKEGQVYEISNFKVKDYLGDEKYRSVRNKKHLFFTPHTQFKEIETNVQDLIKIQKNEEEKTLFKFEISNGRNEPEVLVKHKEDKAAEITKKSLTVKEIKNLPADFEEEEEEEKFPEILNFLLKQKYTINLYVNEENIKKGSAPTETDATANQTPNTGNSTNNKTRARKVTDALAYNETDTAAIHPHKNIKLEKSQLIFSKDTIIQELADDGVTIPSDSFDFYDHSQLMELTKQTTYLADVVGIIKDYDQLRDLTNKHGKDQKKTKFVITDGSSNVNVTFWDKFGESFDKSMRTETQQPVIIIISGCKVGKWNEVGYFHDKHMVLYKHSTKINNLRRFKFHVIAQDMTGQVQVVLGDREARTVVGRRCSDIADEVSSEDALPKSLLSIVDKDYSIVIQLREMNVVNNFNVYWASNICHGFVGIPKETSEIIQSKEPQHSQDNILLAPCNSDSAEGDHVETILQV
ncbi:hypothetical protein ACET3Z_012872 [Daucus carota]